MVKIIGQSETNRTLQSETLGGDLNTGGPWGPSRCLCSYRTVWLSCWKLMRVPERPCQELGKCSLPVLMREAVDVSPVPERRQAAGRNRGTDDGKAERRRGPPVCCCCEVASVVSNSVRPHRRQPTRLPRPWDSPGKNSGVGCLLQCMKVKSESGVV